MTGLPSHQSSTLSGRFLHELSLVSGPHVSWVGWVVGCVDSHTYTRIDTQTVNVGSHLRHPPPQKPTTQANQQRKAGGRTARRSP